MLKTYKPTIALLLTTLAGVGGVQMDDQLAAQGADLVIGAVGAVATLVAFALKLWASRQAAANAPAASNAASSPGGPAALLVLLLLSPLLLAGCASQKAETPAQAVYALAKEHQAAQQLVLAYVEAPGATPSLVIALNDLDRAVYESLQAAQVAVRAGNDPKLPALIAAARNALAVLTRRLAIEGLMPQPPPNKAALAFAIPQPC